MHKLFSDASIKRKLMLITIATSTLALLLASVGFVLYDLSAFKTRMREDLETQAKIIGANSMAALAFRDESAVTEFLSALRAKRDVEVAAIYTPDGALFSVYKRDPSGHSSVPSRPEASGSRFAPDSLRVFHAVAFKDQVLGTLYIQSDMQQWNERLRSYSMIVFVLMLGSAAVALLLSSRLQRTISEPILDLERAMKAVSSQKTFSLRLTRTQDDEIGALIDGFNEMLTEIQHRDAALQARRAELEQEVCERVRAQDQLKTLNVTLEQRVADRSAAAEQRAEEVARSKDALHKQTRILRSILDSMSDGVIVADEGGRVILSNPAATDLLHLEGNDRLTSTWIERHGFYRPDMTTPYPHADFPLTLAVGGTAVAAAQVYVVAEPDREEGTWLSIDAMPLTDEDGVLHNGVAILHNITAQRAAEQALLRAKDAAVAASLAKSQFLANMSHELRTPLNAIIGYSEILQEVADDEGHTAAIPDLQKIHGAGKHLQSLIDDILDLSKIEAGKMDFYLESFEVGPLVSEVTSTVTPLITRNGNTLDFSCPADVGCIRADLTRLRQVLLNLLSNAGKFTHDGAVRLEVSREEGPGDGWILFAVTDTGIGMTEEQTSRLFQDFTQGDASTTRRYGGTGLGLAISRRFSHMMGGDIIVDSREGVGSTFTLRIPATTLADIDADGPEGDLLPASTEDVVAPRPTRTTAAMAPDGITVLVVDDDPATRELMRRLLEKEGLRVLAAADGTSAVSMARRDRPSIITLDILMPDVDGWTTLAALKADPDTADIPVVIVSMTDDRRLGHALGACDYLVKPVDPTRLIDLVERHVGGRSDVDVLLVDDDSTARSLIRRQLVKEGWNISEAANGRAALESAATAPAGRGRARPADAGDGWLRVPAGTARLGAVVQHSRPGDDRQGPVQRRTAAAAWRGHARVEQVRHWHW